jgi:hypothetical protein
LIVIAIIGILVAILLPAVQVARDAARRSHCCSNLKQIGLGLHQYHDIHGNLPPGGVQIGSCSSSAVYTSWPIEILPFIEEDALYQKYDQHAYNHSPINAAVRETFVPTYMCPSEPAPFDLAGRENGPGAHLPWAPGSYKGMTGISTRDNSWNCYLIQDQPPRLPIRFRGPLHTVGNPGPVYPSNGKLKPVRFRQIVDGLTHTIVAGERAIELGRDGKSHPRRTAWACSYSMYTKSSAHLDDPRIFMRDFELCRNQVNYGFNMVCLHGWSSFHPGGTHFVHCDGSTYFQTDDIDLELFASKATIAGGD